MSGKGDGAHYVLLFAATLVVVAAYMMGVLDGRGQARALAAECQRAVEDAETKAAFIRRSMRLTLDTWEMQETGILLPERPVRSVNGMEAR